MKPTQTIEGIVLERTPSGEKFFRISLFSPAEGQLHCMLRQTRKQTPPDLFNILSAQMEQAASGSNYFIKSFEVQKDFHAISHSYAALKRATDITKILSSNLHHTEIFEPLYHTYLKALEAFSNKFSPEATFLKTLYLFSREEGYPVKEQWIQQLKPAERDLAVAVINTPLAELRVDENTLITVNDSMVHWLTYQTDFIVNL